MIKNINDLKFGKLYKIHLVNNYETIKDLKKPGNIWFYNHSFEKYWEYPNGICGLLFHKEIIHDDIILGWLIGNRQLYLFLSYGNDVEKQKKYCEVICVFEELK